LDEIMVQNLLRARLNRGQLRRTAHNISQTLSAEGGGIYQLGTLILLPCCWDRTICTAGYAPVHKSTDPGVPGTRAQQTDVDHDLEHDQEKWTPVFLKIVRRQIDMDHDRFRKK
jgi:hypothetical protein